MSSSGGFFIFEQGSEPPAFAVLANVVRALDAANALHMLVPAIQTAAACPMPEMSFGDARLRGTHILQDTERRV
jgi:hypothetical protein